MSDLKRARIGELTEDDVLRVDPVTEYDRRREMREASDTRLAMVRDDSDAMVESGRPTGP